MGAATQVHCQFSYENNRLTLPTNKLRDPVLAVLTHSPFNFVVISSSEPETGEEPFPREAPKGTGAG